MGQRSRRGLGLGIGIAALALGVAWFAWSGGRAAVERDARAAERTERSTAALDEPVRARDTASEAIAEQRTVRELALEATPIAPPIALDATRQFLVRVVRASDEQPI